MKRVHFLMTVIIITLMLVACGNNDNDQNNIDGNVNTNPNEQEQPGNTNDNDKNQDTQNDETNNTSGDTENPEADMLEQMENLAYTKFDLEVEYSDDVEYEAELKLRNDHVEAELEDELNNVKLKGKEAFDKVYPTVLQLDISQSSEKDEAISQTLAAFNLDADYVKFELEIEFKDGTKIEFKD